MKIPAAEVVVILRDNVIGLVNRIVLVAEVSDDCSESFELLTL